MYSTAKALCIKNTLTDQIGLGRLTSMYEMFCFEKTVFKTFKLWHVLKPETTGTKPPEQPERNHRNNRYNRNDRNKNRKRPKSPKPKSNTEFHLLDLPRPYY